VLANELLGQAVFERLDALERDLDLRVDDRVDDDLPGVEGLGQSRSDHAAHAGSSVKRSSGR
jgi:hypothetical protein